MLNDCYFQIKPNGTKIEIVQLAHKDMSKNLNFTFSLENTREIKIGRDKSCEICLNDKSYSKFQCTIAWDEFLEFWKISDGGPKGPSRNGSWVFVSRSYEITDGTIFRVANSKIQANILFD